jgi:ubiquinone/menaquinone biosynthesis C-methylase UbiE
MESPLVVGIYESRLWRRSPIVALLLGISFEREQQKILDAAALRGDETVLDLACGTGIYGRPLARVLPRGRVVGLDLSPPMLATARSRARREGLANLSLVRGDAQSLPLAAGRFDVVLCSAALHLIPDVTRVLQEAARVLKPGGQVILAVFRIQHGWLADLTAAARREVGTHAFSREDLEARLTGAGLADVRELHARGGWLIVSARKV